MTAPGSPLGAGQRIKGWQPEKGFTDGDEEGIELGSSDGPLEGDGVGHGPQTAEPSATSCGTRVSLTQTLTGPLSKSKHIKILGDGDWSQPDRSTTGQLVK